MNSTETIGNWTIEHEGSEHLTDLTYDEAMTMAQSVASEFEAEVDERTIKWGEDTANAIYVGEQLFAIEIWN